MTRLLLACALLLALFVSAGCATTTDEGTTGAAPVAETTGAAAEEGAAEDANVADTDEGETAKEGEDEDAETTSAPGRGMAHRRMSDEHHREMLDEAIAQGLITEDDATFFIDSHAILDEASERPMDESGMADETKKTVQRARVQAAIAAGTLTEEDGDRFTKIHDLLIDNGLMDE